MLFFKWYFCKISKQRSSSLALVRGSHTIWRLWEISYPRRSLAAIFTKNQLLPGRWLQLVHLMPCVAWCSAKHWCVAEHQKILLLFLLLVDCRTAHLEFGKQAELSGSFGMVVPLPTPQNARSVIYTLQAISPSGCYLPWALSAAFLFAFPLSGMCRFLS